MNERISIKGGVIRLNETILHTNFNCHPSVVVDMNFKIILDYNLREIRMLINPLSLML